VGICLPFLIPSRWIRFRGCKLAKWPKMHGHNFVIQDATVKATIHFCVRHTTKSNLRSFRSPVASVLLRRYTPRPVEASTQISSIFHHLIISESTFQSVVGTTRVGRAIPNMFFRRYGHAPQTRFPFCNWYTKCQEGKIPVTIYTPYFLYDIYLARPL
jgi:hypothetical protein